MTEDQSTDMPDTETNEPTEPTEAAAAPEGQQPDSGDEGNREAAKYRRRLRETEKERDALHATVEALQRAAVESVAQGTLSKPAGLWAAGVELADVLDEHGQPDPEKITAAARSAADSLGLARPLRNHVAREGATPAPVHRTRFEDALRDR